jgi:hypothetical protein
MGFSGVCVCVQRTVLVAAALLVGARCFCDPPPPHTHTHPQHTPACTSAWNVSAPSTLANQVLSAGVRKRAAEADGTFQFAQSVVFDSASVAAKHSC